MSIIYMLLAISVVVALVFFVAFIVSVKKGQYDDTYTPSVRMLFDDELVKEKSAPITPEPIEKSIQIKE
ncbi:cbb3-type cytochrome oxidase assembly protein CcoS [Dokdonia sp. Asnod3-C12]|jgi:cbb3-type cytochrome oxidase maturation protein|uniref:cbb3-type cytochrome oxidase assembly protein CcoS n=1 Tax=Dokdonia sp. Asnod3-C12 TaxID=3160575 RepID=UPI0038666D11